MTKTLELVGVAEIAALAGVSRELVRKWQERGKLPEPAARLQMGPVWRTRDIERWLAKR